MNRDQFECKFKQYEGLHACGKPRESEPQATPDRIMPEERSMRPTGRSERPQVVAIGPRGFSLTIDGIPVFLAFRDHPAFANASAADLRQVHRPYGDRLHWPTLGVKVSLADLRTKGSGLSVAPDTP